VIREREIGAFGDRRHVALLSRLEGIRLK
jgi:hypothetical protein